MSKFSETKERIASECGTGKKTFNEAMFNQLGTAILNDPEYAKEELVVKKGELTPVTSTPIKDLRKAIIGSVAKAAGSDSTEQQKLIDEHQFPTLPLYDYVDSTLHEYLGMGKKFPMSRKENFQGALEFTEQKATVKDVKRPGATESKKQRQGAYIKLKAKSTCPDNLKEDL